MSACRYALLFAASLVLFSGCGTPPKVVNHENVNRFTDIAARADTLYSITIAELYQKLDQSNLLPSGGELSAQQVADELDRIVVDTLAGYMCDTIDLSKHYDYHRLYRNRYYDYLIRAYGSREIFRKIPVDSAEVENYYQEHIDQFTRKEEVFAWHILVSPTGLKYGPDSLRYRLMSPDSLETETEKYAFNVKRVLDEGTPFKQAILEYSHDNSVPLKRGVLGWVSRETYEDPFDSVAFSLKPGEYSAPYKTGNGWHLVYVEDRRPTETAPLDQRLWPHVEDLIRAERADSAARPIIDSLDKAANLVLNEAIIDTNVYYVPKPEWAAIVNGTDTVDFADLQALEDGYRHRFGVDNTTLEMKQQMVRDAARRYLLVQAARAASIDTLPDVIEEQRRTYHQQQKTVFLLDSRREEWMPSDSLIEAYYQTHLQEYDIAKPLTVQHIVSPDSATAAFLRDQAMAGTDFLSLAEEFYPGEPSVRRDLADLGEIGPLDMSPEFYEAARITPVGQVSQPVRTDHGWHIIKVLAHRQPMTVGQARHLIVPILKEEHRRQVFNAFRDRLYSHYGVTFPAELRPFHLRPMRERQAEPAVRQVADSVGETNEG